MSFAFTRASFSLHEICIASSDSLAAGTVVGYWCQPQLTTEHSTSLPSLSDMRAAAHRNIPLGLACISAHANVRIATQWSATCQMLPYRWLFTCRASLHSRHVSATHPVSHAFMELVQKPEGNSWVDNAAQRTAASILDASYARVVRGAQQRMAALVASRVALPLLLEPVKASSDASRLPIGSTSIPRGVYMYGGVGVGKTALMDALAHALRRTALSGPSPAAVAAILQAGSYRSVAVVERQSPAPVVHEEPATLLRDSEGDRAIRQPTAQTVERVTVGNAEVAEAIVNLADPATNHTQAQSTCFSVSSLPTHIPTRRVHFHAFMLEIHARIHAWKQQLLATTGRDKHVIMTPERDAIAAIATEMAREAWVLCLDEFQVTDVADALILTRFFTTIWAQGTVVIATSNTPPDRLYWNGLNREYFLPFIRRLQEMCVVHHVSGTVDHRQLEAGGVDGWISCAPNRGNMAPMPHGSSSLLSQNAHGIPHHDGLRTSSDWAVALVSHLCEACCTRMSVTATALECIARGERPPQPPPPLPQYATPIATAHGRSIEGYVFPHCRANGSHLHSGGEGSREDVDSIVVISFGELCDRPLGAVDYLALCQHASCVVILGVPRLLPQHHDLARRLVTFIDVAYEYRMPLVVTAQEHWTQIFSAFHGSAILSSGIPHSDRSSENVVAAPVQLAPTADGSVPSILAESSAILDLTTATRRAASRLAEMLNSKMQRTFLTHAPAAQGPTTAS